MATLDCLFLDRDLDLHADYFRIPAEFALLALRQCHERAGSLVSQQA